MAAKKDTDCSSETAGCSAADGPSGPQSSARSASRLDAAVRLLLDAQGELQDYVRENLTADIDLNVVFRANRAITLAIKDTLTIKANQDQ